MGPTKIMIIRHAEKPGTYGSYILSGINRTGQPDASSLVTTGWERGGAIANLFYPTNGAFQNAGLATPTMIYASDPTDKSDGDEPSQRPYQTITPLYSRIGSSVKLNISFTKKHYHDMVKDALKQSGVVLISWQHEDILPEKPGDECILTHLLKETGTTPSGLPVPTGPWPGSRYDMVLVLDRPSGTGAFTAFTQVPQMLLAGDSPELFPA